MHLIVDNVSRYGLIISERDVLNTTHPAWKTWVSDLKKAELAASHSISWFLHIKNEAVMIVIALYLVCGFVALIGELKCTLHTALSNLLWHFSSSLKCFHCHSAISFSGILVMSLSLMPLFRSPLLSFQLDSLFCLVGFCFAMAVFGKNFWRTESRNRTKDWDGTMYY